MARLTIADIAREAGVSKGAVSFALNGRPGVSEETRARILQVAERMQWRPHSAARALGRSSAQLVGLVSARPARTLGVEPFFAQIVSGLQAGLSAGGIGLQLLVVEDTATEIEVYRGWSAEHRVDGVVLMDIQASDPRIAEVMRLGLPAVVLGDPLKGQAISTVSADDKAAMRRIVDYLAAIGHTRIHHIAGMAHLRHTRARSSALRTAAKALDLQVTTTTTDFSDTEGAAATRAALSSSPTPTALVFDSDIMAVAGLAVAMEMGAEVPADVSIVSFDDSVLVRLMHPAITALSRDTFALGEQVAATLVETIKNPGEVVRTTAAAPQLVVRESTAPLR
ncbi:LacI family DNA-binding transcriptional regulator [Luteipulveratus mongoliensis]|uniref:LacI family transcriptional regulator n=1 Tax=Luteipulveratus mongoliensis TaxID=571913 RepID=A0A0K1JID4_9MICO|nr:LacI family DNA-binding transcriptional regulator [Luteipulveratus mongoliensis]AKU16466.1 LacI family transcriptional regulator [Luteipulveratus mongoliensis]